MAPPATSAAAVTAPRQQEPPEVNRVPSDNEPWLNAVAPVSGRYRGSANYQRAQPEPLWAVIGDEDHVVVGQIRGVVGQPH